MRWFHNMLAHNAVDYHILYDYERPAFVVRPCVSRQFLMMAQVEEEDKTTQTAGESQEVPAKESGKLRAPSIDSQGSLASAASYSSNESSLASGRVDDDESESDFFEPSKEFEDVEHFYRRVSKKLKAQDKVSFTLGVWNLLLTAYCFGAHTRYFIWLYTIKYIVLLTLRFVTYHAQKWHYFMLDVCYYVNSALLLYCWVAPSTPQLFHAIYALTHGPLLMAVALFRNSLVFHSADKLTSAFIHISPFLLTHLIRWYPEDFSDYVICNDDACMPGFYELCLLPGAAFVVHELYYFFMTGFVKRKKLESEPAYLTSFRYLVTMPIVSKVLGIFGKRFRLPMFIVCNGLYGLLTVLPAYFYWRYYYLEMAVLVIMLTISVYNGACFYVEVFAMKQHQKYNKFGKVEITPKKKPTKAE